MAPVRELRLSRGSIHPGGATPHIKDAFGPRTQNTSREWAGTPIPDTVSIPEFKSFDQSEDTVPEDTSGGIPTLEKNNDRDSLFFRDGKRRIDLIIVYEEDDIDLGVLSEIETIRMETRRQFNKNLEKEGLELELESKQASYDQKTYFLKVHVPWKVLTRYAEVMNMKMPIKSFKRLFRADSPPSSGRIMSKDDKKRPPVTNK
ncbi:unnamed protein product [Nezara viridula]|uniref:Anoctamin dimerisation domain-containing protein n=1 Tax=Nezara viridula TaxID=85310 RepID=A0A9P0H0S9_NEZVI|nr:unnamed protein product [Nezara viridula]